MTDKLGENLSDNPDFDDDDNNRSFASATNDIDPNSHDRVDYVNDGSDDETRRWTNWSPTPSDNPSFSDLSLKQAGKIVERTVAEGSIRFFSDGGTDAPSKLVLERYVGPEFASQQNTTLTTNHTIQNIHSTLLLTGRKLNTVRIKRFKQVLISM